MSVPAVDVVILTWNDGALLDDAVGSVLASIAVDVRVIVVDNGSEPPAGIGADPRITLLRNERNLGVAAGRNQGARAGSSPLICFLDSDARLAPTSLRNLVGALRQDVVMAVPVFQGQLPEESAGAAPTLSAKAGRVLGLRTTYKSCRRHPDAQAWDVDFGIGACQLFTRRAFEAVGGLDESYFYGPEDVDFCLRLRERGWRVVQVDGDRVEHPPRRRNRRLFTRRGVQHARAVVRHLWRHRRCCRRSASVRP